MRNKEQKKKKGVAVQDLLGFKAFTDYGVSTNRGELLLYEIRPTNLSVLSAASVENKIREMTMLLAAIPEIEIACIDSSECFDENKAYLSERAEQEKNKKVRELLQKDIAFLDDIQLEMATARQFLFIAKCRGMNAQQVFHYANAVQKAIHEQGFEVHRLEKGEIKRLLALYFDASLFGEQIPDTETEPFFDRKGAESK
mgnify:FL=1